LNFEILSHFRRMGQSVILALHFLFFLLIHVLLQYLYSWIDAHSLEEVTLRNGL